MKTLLVQLFYFLLLVSTAVVSSEKKLSTGEIYLEEFLAKTQTLEAVFQQTLRTHDGEILQQTEGKFYLNRPGKFRWDYQLPYEQKIVSDGERVWIYDVDLRQVTVQRQDVSLPSSPMTLLQDSTQLYKSFHVVPLDNHDGVYRLKLKSKTNDSDFVEVVVGLDKRGLRFMQLHDQFEQVTDIVFSNIKTNPKLSNDIFDFVPPEGVDVFGG